MGVGGMLGGNRYPTIISTSWLEIATERAAAMVSSPAHRHAFRMGYLAHLTGKKRKENPYHSGRGWPYYWGAGWRCSADENETVTFSTDLAAETKRRKR